MNELFGLPKDSSMTGLNAARLSGIRELYLLLTGDYDLHGGHCPGTGCNLPQQPILQDW